MDPLSITASAIGVTGFATTSIVQLHNLIDGLSEAQDVVIDIASSLANIERPLDALGQRDEAQERRRKLQKEPEDEEDGGAQRTLAIKETEEQARLLEADQVSCGVVFLQVRLGWSGQEISNIITSNDFKALVGMPESVVVKINQRITDVRTEGGAIAVMGMYSGNISWKGL